MWMHLVYFKLELKRALKKLPNMVFGAIVLLVLLGTIALFSSQALYGDRTAGRILVGVVLPEDDLVAKQAVSMISSLDSVKSLCDFRYVGLDEGLTELRQGKLYVVMEVPEGFVQDIMNGTNTPVRLIFPENAGLESRLFKELADAGARTLGAAQAGIYAGDELCIRYELDGSVGELEAALNRIFLSYSLPRADYFRHYQVNAAGDVNVMQFYGISGFVLLVLLLAIPVSGYLMPWNRGMKQKLNLAGVGNAARALGRILGLTALFMAMVLPLGAVAYFCGQIQAGVLLLAVTSVLVCLASASLVVLLYQAAGTLLGGMMLLFFAVTGQHFLAGGFLPLVFLPPGLQRMAPVLPSSVLMDGVKMAVTGVWSFDVVWKLAALALIGFTLTAVMEVTEE